MMRSIIDRLKFRFGSCQGESNHSRRQSVVTNDKACRTRMAKQVTYFVRLEGVAEWRRSGSAETTLQEVIGVLLCGA